jgi:nitrous oxidase accessory protein NosD
MSHKSLLILISLVGVCLVVASGTVLTVQAQTANPDIVVSPGEPIQDAIDNAAPGDTIQLEAGTYEQGITIDKNLKITTSGDVTLDGKGVGTQHGIVVKYLGVKPRGFTVLGPHRTRRRI